MNKQRINTAMQEAMRKARTQLFSIKTTCLVRYAYYHLGTWSEVDKAAVPVALKYDFPVFFFGEFDAPIYETGFKLYPLDLTRDTYPFLPYQYAFTTHWALRGVYFYQNYVPDTVNVIIPYPTTFLKFLKQGDLIFEYSGDDPGDYYKAFVIVTCDKMSYSSLLRESSFKAIETRNILYFSDNIRNYNEPINIMKFSPVGLFKADFYNALASKPIDTVQQDFIKMDLQLRLDRYCGLYTRIKFDTNRLTFEYNFNY